MTSILLIAAMLGFPRVGPAIEDEAQDAAAEAVGHWVGELKIGPAALTLVLHVERDDEGRLSATLDSPDQGSEGIEVATVEVEDSTFGFTAPKIAASYKGTFGDEGDAIDGTFTQAGRKTPLRLVKTAAEDLPKPAEAPASLAGNWQGPIELPGGIELRVVLRVVAVEGREGAFKPFFDSIDQGVKGIPVTAIEREGRAVRFEVRSIGGTFEGTLDEEETAIEGTWSQAGQDFPLTLKLVDEVAALKRPQHPEPPFSYGVEEVRIPNEAAGIELAGTLTLPEGDGPFPAAVLVSGSGPQDRDESLLGHKPFLVIADHLTRAGIAVLRFDDRGVGGSSGDHSVATTVDFATDALAALRFLQGRPEVKPGAVGLIGHSEGGLIAPLAAADAPEEVGFVVMLAGPGVDGRAIIVRQSRLIAAAGGASTKALDAQERSLVRLLAILDEEGDEPVSDEQIKALVAESIAELGEEDRAGLGEASGTVEESVARSVERMRSPWFRFFLTHDPRPTLRSLSCPVLAIFGANDLQVDPEQNASEVEAALAEAPTDDMTVRVLDGLNHLFQHAENGSPAEYARIEETFAPEALELIAGWIIERYGDE